MLDVTEGRQIDLFDNFVAWSCQYNYNVAAEANNNRQSVLTGGDGDGVRVDLDT